MAGRERDWDENANGSPDPETLYTKEYCIGTSHASCPPPWGGRSNWKPGHLN